MDGERLPTNDEALYHLLDRVLTLSSSTFGAVSHAMRALDLNVPVANLLWQLDPERPAPSMGEVAGKMYVDPSTVTSLVDRLEDRGLVERHASDRDRRVKVVLLTEDGRRLREKLVEIVTTRSPLGVLTREERDQLWRILAKALPQEEYPAPPEVFQ